MNDVEQGSTQPVKVQAAPPSKSRRVFIWLWALAAILLLSLGVASGAFAGYRTGMQTLENLRSEKFVASLEEQFNLGVDDYEAGRYEVARQRFQYIFEQNPAYPGLEEKMAAVLTILYATATPTPITPTPTITVTPTRDVRPIEDRYTHALEQMREGDWSGAIDTVLGLRKTVSSTADEPVIQVSRLDGMLYMSLRQRGVQKIYRESNLEGGIYDLSLAENFGPLDLEADVARNMARLYLYGSSFWEAYPQQAVYYFGQVAAAMPYLRDASGWTATERYRAALIQFGDQLFRSEDWCAALEQYQLAAAIRSDAALSSQIDNAALACTPPTATLANTAIPTFTLSPTPTSTFAAPPTAPPLTPTPTPEPPTVAPPPTETPAPLPTDTAAPTEPPPTETPAPPVDTPTSGP